MSQQGSVQDEGQCREQIQCHKPGNAEEGSYTKEEKLVNQVADVKEQGHYCQSIHSNDSQSKKEKLAIMKNVVSLSVAMTFLFSSYFSLENLQSSLNKTGGTISLAAIYASFMFSSCFLSTLLLQTLKEKYTLFICSISYVAYMVAQLYPRIYVIIPTAILLGLSAGPLWAAQGTYITKIAERYAQLTGKSASHIITKFFGIFFMFFQTTQIWGNLISASVLSVDGVSPTSNASELQTTCGYMFCLGGGSATNESHSTETRALPQWQTYALTAFYISGAIASSAIIFFALDSLHKYKNSEGDTSSNDVKFFQLLAATVNHLRHPYQLLLVPLTIWSGIERSFLAADFTAAYVSCFLGSHMVGYAMICYGICNAIGCMSSSYLVKVLGRVLIITMAFLINMTVIISLVLWLIRSDYLVWYFVIAGLWGLADSVWMTQINALYGTLFQDRTEAAFSNCRLWESTGFTLSFALSSVLCFRIKIIVVIIFLVLGVIGYYIIEFLEIIGGLPKREEKIIPLTKLSTSSEIH